MSFIVVAVVIFIVIIAAIELHIKPETDIIIIDTFIGYTHVVEKNSNDPYVYTALEKEEYLVSIDDFILTMKKYNPALCKALKNSPVTDVLILRGW